MRTVAVAALAVVFSAIVAGCVAPASEAILDSEQSQVELRSYQTRAFDTADKEKTVRIVIATMQDLGFVIDKADAMLGMVTGTKLNMYTMRLTVTVRPRSATQLLVRANAQYNLTAIEDPKPYQDFFTALEKSMFLTAQQVD